jgi:hypothetical protein
MQRVLRFVGLVSASILGFIPQTATARDSFRAVCSGFAELQAGGSTDKMGISIDFVDIRHGSGSRKYTVSSIYQGLLFQGIIIDRSEAAIKARSRSRIRPENSSWGILN